MRWRPGWCRGSQVRHTHTNIALTLDANDDTHPHAASRAGAGWSPWGASSPPTGGTSSVGGAASAGTGAGAAEGSFLAC